MGYMNNMSDIEKEIIEKNLTAPRVTPDSIQNKIKSTQYYVFPGTTFTTAGKMLETRPERVVEMAVKGMLPKNSLGRKMFTKLKVYAGAEHPHAAQMPEVLEINVR